jgi:hypothetical protein
VQGIAKLAHCNLEKYFEGTAYQGTEVEVRLDKGITKLPARSSSQARKLETRAFPVYISSEITYTQP